MYDVKPTIEPNRTRYPSAAQDHDPPAGSLPNRTPHKHTVPTSNTVIPQGTERPARHTPPFPRHSSKKPVMKGIRQCAAVGRTPVFQRSMGYRIEPASRWRVPASNNGGRKKMPLPNAL